MDHRPSLPLTRLVRSLPAGPPQVHAFAGGARTSAPEGHDLLTWLLPQAPDEAHGLRLRVRGGGLPAPTLAAAKPDLSLWELPEPGWMAPRATTRRLLSLAAAVPLALAPAVAHAGDEAAEEPTEEQALTDEERSDQVKAILAESTLRPDLSTTGNLLWDSLVHNRVELSLADGAKLFGRVLTQAPDEIALILDQDGFVMRVPKDSILRIRVLELPDGIATTPKAARDEVEEKVRTPPDGKGATIAGAILTATGGGLLSVYAVGAAVDSSFGYYMAPLAIAGGWTLGGGVPILITGLVQQEQYGKWQKEHGMVEPELEVGMAPTVGGWSGALTVRW